MKVKHLALFLIMILLVSNNPYYINVSAANDNTNNSEQNISIKAMVCPYCLDNTLTYFFSVKDYKYYRINSYETCNKCHKPGLHYQFWTRLVDIYLCDECGYETRVVLTDYTYDYCN